jgi:hypothetical protein
MKEIDVAESFALYYEILENADRFIAFDFDNELLEFVFTELATDLNSFYHQNTLNRLLDNGYINNEIEELSTQLRNHYFSMIDADKWDVEKLNNKDAEWIELFSRIKEIKEKVDKYPGLKKY